MIYLVLYDSRGQCQRVARTNSRQAANAYLRAGFVEVDRSEYERCAEIAPSATIDELRDIQTATALIQQIAQAPRVPRTVPAADIQALDRLTSRQRDKLREITTQFVQGDISQAQWYRQIVNAINAGNIAASALAVGGIDNLTDADRREIERANEIQIQYLNGFRRDLENISDAQKVARAALYAGATTSRYWTAHTRAQGLVLPAMPGVRTSCGSNCKCNWQINQLDGNGNWDCYWRISAAEHCEECLRRQRVFNPLRVRNYVAEPFNPNGIYT